MKKALALAGSIALGGLLLVTAASASSGWTPTTTRLDVSSSDRQANGGGALDSISANGRYVVFDSGATNLVPRDTNRMGDVFVHDRRTGRTTRVDLSSSGRQANTGGGGGEISANGRYVAFTSTASNLVARDTNHTADVFLHDRRTGRTTRISVGVRGVQGNGESYGPAISAGGRYVAFSSSASNLVAGDTNGFSDVFVRDRVSGTTERVSVSSNGAQATGAATGTGSNAPAISADGRYVAFHSECKNLVAGDTNHAFDTFVRDRKTGRTTRISVSSSGAQANGESLGPASISENGRYVAFASLASNLTADDSNGVTDVFVRDLRAGVTTRVSLGVGGVQGNDTSFSESISANGRYVVFGSDARDLVPGDTNNLTDVFVRDRVAGTTQRISLTRNGGQANGGSLWGEISADARSVVFDSGASNLVSGDTNQAEDVFVRDLRATGFHR